MLKSLLGLLDGVFRAFNNLFDAKNTKEFKTAKTAQVEVDKANEIEKAVEKKDAKKISELISE